MGKQGTFILFLFLGLWFWAGLAQGAVCYRLAYEEKPESQNQPQERAQVRGNLICPDGKQFIFSRQPGKDLYLFNRNLLPASEFLQQAELLCDCASQPEPDPSADASPDVEPDESLLYRGNLLTLDQLPQVPDQDLVTYRLKLAPKLDPEEHNLHFGEIHTTDRHLSLWMYKTPDKLEEIKPITGLMRPFHASYPRIFFKTDPNYQIFPSGLSLAESRPVQDGDPDVKLLQDFLAPCNAVGYVHNPRLKPFFSCRQTLQYRVKSLYQGKGESRSLRNLEYNLFLTQSRVGLTFLFPPAGADWLNNPDDPFRLEVLSLHQKASTQPLVAKRIRLVQGSLVLFELQK